jgi:hypothetical protein
MYRPSFRIQFGAVLTAVLFLFATMSSLSASAQPLSSAKAVPASKPAAKPENANANKSTKSLNSFVQASATNTSTGASTTFIGNLTITGFTVANSILYATGTLTGNTVEPNSSTQTGTVMIPVTAIDPPSCNILTLSLGTLDVNLLGLVVHLNPVFLTITAVPGAGNLLGNLLCDVANLLNSGSPLSTLLTNLSNLLTQILGAL